MQYRTWQIRPRHWGWQVRKDPWSSMAVASGTTTSRPKARAAAIAKIEELAAETSAKWLDPA